ncbi:dienelactone hydrolase family protein [Sneathiella chinensis]|uniref:Carboxymethylenebutenolidase n=1 Tax=Sneathiella chinensis TaxID=349750 RepID=A0ABQ5U6Y1_9PROT|nr:dienelactone hydrolase family protein [Sneathiella chinensis]GLQ06221.1 carboxymethylenebutenolidase [Sneathiella chinensis]
MGKMIEISAADGHRLQAYLSPAAGTPKGGVVILQEIFGVNGHIQDVCNRFASHGYTAIAPALFDREQRNVDLGYDEAGMKEGIRLKNSIRDEDALLDIEAARQTIADVGSVSCIGYCWGGRLAYLAACNLPAFAKAIGYYGGGIIGLIDQKPQIPTMLHFGDQDHAIPMTDVDTIMNAHPEVRTYIYQAQHGFNCDKRSSYNAAAAKLALDRSMQFLSES